MIKKRFLFTWIPKNCNFERHNIITVLCKPSEVKTIAIAADRATSVFQKTFGNLKQNDIVSIQEIGEDNTYIGEPIVPSEG